MVSNFDRRNKREPAGNLSGFLERSQPHSVDCEQALLACCIIEGGQDCVTLAIQSKISVASFYLPAHRVLWAGIVGIYDAGRPINEIFLGEQLRADGKLESIGGLGFIHRICDRIDTPAHVVHYVKRVRELELVRRVIMASMANIERAYSESNDLEDFIESAENEIFSISVDRITECATHIKKPIDSAINAIQLMRSNRGELIGISSGFTDLDKMTFGFRASEMIVIAARPSMGKTSLAMNIAENIVLPPKGKSPRGVLFFSLEMSSDQLALRMLCGRAGVNVAKLRDGFVSNRAHDTLYCAAKELQGAPLWIDESTNLSILELRAKARRVCSKEDIGIVIIDYLQLISGDSRSPREQQISEISRGVKAMAKELNLPVIVLSQLNRASETERRQPRLSDLRESGAIEQDADIVLLLSKQVMGDDDSNANGTRMDGDVVLRDLIIAKHRNGPIGVVPLTFIRSLTRFENFIENKICE